MIDSHNIFEELNISNMNRINIDNRNNYLLFVLEGSIEINSLEFIGKQLTSKDVIHVLASSELTIYATSDTRIILVNLEIEQYFSLQFISSLSLDSHINYTGFLNINTRLLDFLILLTKYLDDKIAFNELEKVLIEELFILFKLYHSEEELIQLFGASLNNDVIFMKTVIENCLDKNNIEELAELTKYSKSGFIKKFMRCFGLPPYKWILQYKAKRILKDLQASNKQIQEIADYYGFSSHSYFYTFCTQYYGASPSSLRKNRKTIKYSLK